MRKVDPEQFADVMIEQEWDIEPRKLAELREAEDELEIKVWYNRHQIWKERIEDGKITLVEKEDFPSPKTIQRDIWKGALKSAKAVEKEYGIENLGPWTDFEWGMINGKLSAIRWVMGYDWDMLHT